MKVDFYIKFECKRSIRIL